MKIDVVDLADELFENDAALKSDCREMFTTNSLHLANVREKTRRLTSPGR